VRLEGMLYDYDDATVDVTIERELIHIAKAKRGKADGCMNNLACLGHREAFPHPVIAVSVWNCCKRLLNEEAAMAATDRAIP